MHYTPTLLYSINMLKDLSSLSGPELQSFLDSFDNILCDCDGVIWKLNNPLAGVKESIAKLRELGKQIHFVSNNCSYRLEGFQKKLSNFYLDAQVDDIAFPTLAVIDYLKKIQYDCNKEIFLFGLPGMRQEFIKSGYKMAHSGPDRIDERLEELPRNFHDNEEIGAVVMDLDVNLNYVKLLKAIVYLQRPEVLFILAATDKKIPFGFNILLIGPGHFKNVVEDLTGRTAIAFGKPSENFNEFIVKKFNIQSASRTLFIGDALEQDMGFATKYGYQKLLVLTGVTDIDQATACSDEDMMPDFYINSLGDLHELIKNKLNV